MAAGKKYGLIIPTSKNSLFAKKNIVTKRPSVFGNESSSDEDSHKEVNAQIHQEALKKKIQKQTKIDIQKALEQDSTVYEYDSIYDDMKEKTKKKVPAGVAKADKQRKPKYIGNLIKAAEKRAKEKERIEERKIQKEREKEGDEFEDKEEFVTSAYRQKMIERQKDIEEEKRMDAIEDALDVRKQRDLTGFYRNFLNRELCEEPNEEDATEHKKDGEEKMVAQNEDDEDTDLSFSSDEDEEEAKKESSPERRQSSPEKQGLKSKKRQRDSPGRDDNRVSKAMKSRDRDDRTVRDRSDRSPKSKHRHHHSPSHDSRKYERDSHGGRSYERDHRRSSNDRHHDRKRSRSRDRKRRQRSRSRDERTQRRENSKDRDHKKRRMRGRDRSGSRSSSPPRDAKRNNRKASLEDSPSRETASDDRMDKSDTMTGVKAEETKQGVVGPMEEAKPLSSFAKRTNQDKALSARERFLARKAAQRAKPVIDDSD